MLLITAGWDRDHVETVVLDRTKASLFDLKAETTAKNEDVGGMATKLRKLGLKVSPIKRTEKKSLTRWLSETWDSLTLHPWWTTARSRQSLVLVARDTDAAERASATFIRDLWTGLGSEQEERLPVFRRISLVALMSPDTLSKFMEGAGSNTDLLVVHGGFLDADSLYQNFSYLSAVQSMFEGFLLYEAIIPEGGKAERLADVARRSGFHLAVGVG
jgi:hypothetical protein